jgi:creatinine amidohydrolase
MKLDDAPELESMTWQEARDILSLRPVGLIPVGAIEAHGPHLPLDTDSIIARAMAHAGARFLRGSGLPAVVMPVVSYSVSFAGACFPGTTPVGPDAFTAYLGALLASSATQGYRALCICNAHLEPAHVDALTDAVNSARSRSSIPLVFPDQRIDERTPLLGDEFTRGSRHAGSYETSIVMAVAPHSVRRTELEELGPVWIDLPAALKRGARDFAEAGAELGYFGDPASATAEFGFELLNVLGAMIHEHVITSLADEPQ